MKLEHQVCSLDLAKRLKELGVKQESHFVWDRNGGLKMDKEWSIQTSAHSRGVHKYAAFTVAELGLIIEEASSREHSSYPLPYCLWPKWSPPFVGVDYDTEADARAAMLIYLLENKLVTV